jgi:L,D-peptidoglycan transpeptidase YkuD (ErfK/YbiS/YcfS/YnhG family)
MFMPEYRMKTPTVTRPRPRAVSKHAPKKLRRLTATVLPKLSPGAPPRGWFSAGFTSLPCAVGGTAVSHRKREGDLASPAGQFHLLGGFYRSSAPRPAAPWTLRKIAAADGWCDDPRSPSYNRPTRLPSRYSCEQLWRNDGLYDLVLILDYNLSPRRAGRGSAIFLHCARPDFAPTAGCIALKTSELRKLLPRLAKDAVLVIR